MPMLISADSFCVANSQTLQEQETPFSSGNQSLHAGKKNSGNGETLFHFFSLVANKVQ